MYDIHVPNTAYDRQTQQLSNQANSVDDNKDMVCYSLPV